jgi:hypothetical protein
METTVTKQTNMNIGGTKMKFNKWTLGLAAVGAVSLTSVAQAEEKMNVLQTAMTSTTISGYVDTSIQVNPGPGNPGLTPGYSFGGPSKANDFNLNVVQLSIAKPLDESEWAAGYRADLWFGPDANTLATTSTGSANANSDFAIRQAYVALRTPVGNGIDWKMGVFDNIIGYETLEDGNNPNMSRSYGFTIEPTTLTGLLATYRFADWMSASIGSADTVGPTINQRAGNPLAAPDQSSWKAWAGSIALTAPSDWGWLAGSTLYSGFLTGFDASSGTAAGVNNGARNNYYVGMTLTTPVEGLKVGTAVDYVHIRGGTVAGITPTAVVAGAPVYGPVTDQYSVSLYASYQATEKMSLHGRAEWYHQDGNVSSSANSVAAFTGTIQYDLWQNVLSRLEVRWDYSDDAAYGNTTDLQHNAFMIAANVIYKF